MRKLALLLVLPLLVAGCHHKMRSSIQGNGKREIQKRSIGAFTAIETSGAFHIEVTCQKDPSLEVEGDENVLALVTSDVSGSVLHLDNKSDYSVREPITFRITVPNLEGLSVNGAGHIEIKGIKNDKFEIDSQGAPNIIVYGTTKLIDIDSSGAGKIDTKDLHAARAVVDSKGVSRIDVDASDQLDVTVSGPSSVYYKGDPVVNKTVNGPGKVEKRAGEGA
jgi:hypothetical protein